MPSYCSNQFAARSTVGGHATYSLNWDTATLKARILPSTLSAPAKSVADVGDGSSGTYARMTGSSEVTLEDTATIYLDDTNHKLQFKYTPVATLEFANITTGTPKWVLLYYHDGAVNVPLKWIDLGTQNPITVTTTVQVSWSGVSNVVSEIVQ
jgi:hypothetical protein